MLFLCLVQDDCQDSLLFGGSWTSWLLIVDLTQQASVSPTLIAEVCHDTDKDVLLFILQSGGAMTLSLVQVSQNKDSFSAFLETRFYLVLCCRVISL